MATAGDILRSVQQHMTEYGLNFVYDRPGLVHDTSAWKGTIGSLPVRILVLSPMTLSALSREDPNAAFTRSENLKAVVVGQSINERSAAAFRDLDINFMDAAGNAHIRLDGILVDVRGRRTATAGPSDTEKQAWGDDRHARAANLFSSGRAQVICALLTWPALSRAPVREVARTAGVSAGKAHDSLTLLDEAGYSIDRVLRPDRMGELLDLWTAAYPRGLARKLEIASYDSKTAADEVVWAVKSGHLDIDGGDWFELSGESTPGLGIREPQSVTLYTQNWSSRRAVRHRWRAVEVEGQANVHVRRRFWTDPGALSQAVAALRSAPWVIVYADLMGTGDPRLAEAALRWRRQHGPA